MRIWLWDDAADINRIFDSKNILKALFIVFNRDKVIEMGILALPSYLVHL